MTTWHTQTEVDALVRERIAAQLMGQIAAYAGAPQEAKEILPDAPLHRPTICNPSTGERWSALVDVPGVDVSVNIVPRTPRNTT